MIVATVKVYASALVDVDFVDHVLQLGLGGVLTKRSHDGAQLLRRDLS